MQNIKQRAIKHLRIAIENDGQHLPSTIALCDILKENGDVDEVESILLEAIIKSSDSSELHYKLGEIYLKQGKYNESLKSIDRAILLEPNNARFYKLGIELFYATQKEHLAVPYLEKLIDIDRLDGDAHFKLSKLIVDSNEIRRKKLLLEISVDLMPDYVPPIMDLALLLVKIADASQYEKFDKESCRFEAEKLFTKITKLDPKLGKPWYHLGILNFKKNKKETAEKLFYKSLELDDTKGISAYKLGLMNLEKKDFILAEKFLFISYNHNCKKSVSLLEIAIIQEKKKEYKSALNLLNKAIKIVLEEEKNYYKKSDRFLKLSNFDLARKYLQKGIKAKKIHAKILVKTYQVKRNLGIRSNNNSELIKAIQLDSTNFEPYFELGQIFLKEGNIEEAKRNFSLSCNNKWSHLDSHLKMGQVLLKSHEIDNAIMHFKIVLDLNNSHRIAKRLLKSCLKD